MLNKKSIIALFLFFTYSTNASSETLLFYHIPKSAGTSIQTMLGYKYSVNNLYRVYTSQSISPYGEKWVEDPFYFSKTLSSNTILSRNFTPSKETFVFGHIYFKDGFKHFSSAKNITFLRDPIKRLLSHQKYWEICRKYYPSANVNRSHVIPSGRPIDVAHNLQVYYLSSFSREDPSVSLAEHLESAKHNLLNHFDFVGITEHFDESMKALFALFNLGNLPEIPTVNQFSFKKINVSNEQLTELRKLNWADYELYLFATKLFDEKYRNINVKNIKQRKRFVDKVSYTFEQSIEGSGWGYREKSGSQRDICRTSFIKNAWISFNLQKKAYKIKVLANAPLPQNLLKLKIIANEYAIPLRFHGAGPWVVFEGLIPKKAIKHDESTKLTFSIPKLYKPSSHGQILDDRNLGITVTKIEIQPVN